ncbi:MAG TPA: type II toxin-antitoxin system RelE/ParE family toxin [Candidatus Paceibacterota bacterium]
MKNSGKEKYEVFYHKLVKDDILKIDQQMLRKIYAAIISKLVLAPNIYGLPLHGVLKKYWKFRVSDYRIIYLIENKRILIKIIGHRKDVYNTINRRID